MACAEKTHLHTGMSVSILQEMPHSYMLSVQIAQERETSKTLGGQRRFVKKAGLHLDSVKSC